MRIESTRQDRAEESRPATNEDDGLLTAEDLANFLNVPIKTLYAWRYRAAPRCGAAAGLVDQFRTTP